MQRTTDMTKGHPVKLILAFSLPLILSNLGQQFYQITDAAIVGRGIGVKALAAVGATDWIYWMILWTITGFTTGFSTYISRHFGEKDYKILSKTINTSAILCFIIGILLTVLSIVFSKPILRLMDTPTDILNDATIYLTTLMSGTLIITAYNMSSSILRALGDGKSPLIAMVVAAIMNIGLDLLFVMVFKWGVFGAALASVMAQLFSFLYCLVQIRKIDCLKQNKQKLSLDLKKSKELLLFSLPLAAEYICIALGGIFLQTTINAQGSFFVAGFTATNKLYSLLESSSISLGIACSTYLAQNYGAQKFKRVRRGVTAGFWLAVGMSVVVSVISFIFGKAMLTLFLDVKEAGGTEAMDVAYKYLFLLGVFLSVLYLIHIYRNALQAMGISFWSMVSGFGEFVVRTSVALIFIRFTGVEILYLVEPIAWLVALLLVLIPYYFSYRKRLLK